MLQDFRATRLFDTEHSSFCGCPAPPFEHNGHMGRCLEVLLDAAEVRSCCRIRRQQIKGNGLEPRSTGQEGMKEDSVWLHCLAVTIWSGGRAAVARMTLFDALVLPCHVLPVVHLLCTCTSAHTPVSLRIC